MLVKVIFADGQFVDVDTAEFGSDGMGAILDRLATKHGGVVEIKMK